MQNIEFRLKLLVGEFWSILDVKFRTFAVVERFYCLYVTLRCDLELDFVTLTYDLDLEYTSK